MRIKACESQLERTRKQLELSSVKNNLNQKEKLLNNVVKLEDEIKRHTQHPIEKDPLSVHVPNEELKRKPLSKPVFKHHKYDDMGPMQISDRSLNNYYKKFVEKNATVPEYIYRNLKNLPNNRGYIWKDIWYFGEKEPTSEIHYLTEPNKGFVYLHEIHRDKYCIYLKEGRNMPELISLQSRLTK